MDIIQEAKAISAEFKEIEAEYNSPDSLIDMGNWYYISKKQDEVISRLVDRLDVVEVYGIYGAWADTMENHPSRAFGYSLIGVVLSKEEAEKVCNELGAVCKKNYGWAAPEGKPARYYEVLNVMSADWRR